MHTPPAMPPAKTIEFFYDITCPYAYLASTQIDVVASKARAQVEYKPFLLGGLFRDIGQPTSLMNSVGPAKAHLGSLDLRRWASFWNVPLNFPANHPLRSVLALRAALCSGDLRRATFALYRAYWVTGRDISHPSELQEILTEAGFDGEKLLREASGDAAKQELRARTTEAVSRGVFGAPAFFLDGEMYWGQDRLDQLAAKLGSRPATTEVSQVQGPTPSVEFWYDFSSPFAYLGSTQMKRLSASGQAKVEWKPFLLGALFKALDAPMVPLHNFPDAKRRYYLMELHRFAALYNVPFAFPQHFPMNTVKALRLALLCGDGIAELSHALFHAYWAEGRDISDDVVLRRITESVGMSPSLVTDIQAPEVKQKLIEATAQAKLKGLCGAPSFVVGDQLFWGQDRLRFVTMALQGWNPTAQ